MVFGLLFDVGGGVTLRAGGRVAHDAEEQFAARLAAIVARVVLRTLHSNYFKKDSS